MPTISFVTGPGGQPSGLGIPRSKEGLKDPGCGVAAVPAGGPVFDRPDVRAEAKLCPMLTLQP